MFEFYFCLFMYSFSLLFLGWCIGERDGRKKAVLKIKRLKRVINCFYGRNIYQ